MTERTESDSDYEMVIEESKKEEELKQQLDFWRTKCKEVTNKLNETETILDKLRQNQKDLETQLEKKSLYEEKAKEEVESREELQKKLREEVLAGLVQELQGRAKLELRNEVRKELDEQLNNEYREEFQERVKNELRTELEADVRSKLREELQIEMREGIHSLLATEMKDEVLTTLRQECQEEVRVELRQKLQGKVRDELRNEMKKEIDSEIRKELREELREKVRNELRIEMEDEVRSKLEKEHRDSLSQNLIMNFPPPSLSNFGKIDGLDQFKFRASEEDEGESTGEEFESFENETPPYVENDVPSKQNGLPNLNITFNPSQNFDLKRFGQLENFDHFREELPDNHEEFHFGPNKFEDIRIENRGFIPNEPVSSLSLDEYLISFPHLNNNDKALKKYQTVYNLKDDNYSVLRTILFSFFIHETNVSPPNLPNLEEFAFEHYWILENDQEFMLFQEGLRLFESAFKNFRACQSFQQKLDFSTSLFQDQYKDTSLMEGLKVLMIARACLHFQKFEKKEAEDFVALLFCNEETETPEKLMKNFIRKIGKDRVASEGEINLLADCLKINVQLFRLQGQGRDSQTSLVTHPKNTLVPIITGNDQYYSALY